VFLCTNTPPGLQWNDVQQRVKWRYRASGRQLNTKYETKENTVVNLYLKGLNVAYNGLKLPRI